MITITIRTDNAAFGETPGDTADEVARILARLAEQLREAGAFRFHKVRDGNGNTVGAVELTGKDRAL